MVAVTSFRRLSDDACDGVGDDDLCGFGVNKRDIWRLLGDTIGGLWF